MYQVKPILLINNFTREEVEQDKDYLYLFTDNLLRTSGSNLGNRYSHYARVWCMNSHGYFYYPNSSQAVIRGLPNAFPITTMKNPYKVQLTDELDYTQMCKIWNLEFNDIINNASKYKGIKCSDRQFGNGKYSRLIEQPKLFSILSMHLADLGINNEGPVLSLYPDMVILDKLGGKIFNKDNN